MLSSISAKCSDLFSCVDLWRTYDYCGYPHKVCPEISDQYGDYVEFTYCRDCGQIQGKWKVGNK